MTRCRLAGTTPSSSSITNGPPDDISTATSGAGGVAGFNSFNPFVNQIYTRPREIGVQANYRF